mmetsp:Transcript_8886/g.22039  ORF Transcript_8886/g.22039 Transcript_8886/m.22039 type:complete len:294 (-) Transcript_8886:233-1114(-)
MASEQAAELTKEEQEAVEGVIANLKLDSSIPPEAFERGYEIIATTLICKCRVDKATEKYKRFCKMLETFGVHKLGAPTDKDFDGISPHQWGSYRVCGKDKDGRQVLWINGQPIPPENEAACIRASTWFFFAVHADLHTLREGVTFVIDSSSNQQEKEKYGNERKMQEAWQAYPLRPKHFLIVGTSFLQRLFINAIITLIGAFAYNNKVLKRLKFTSMDEVRGLVPSADMPTHLGGDAREDVKTYVQRRINGFPGWKAQRQGDPSLDLADMANLSIGSEGLDTGGEKKREVFHM